MHQESTSQDYKPFTLGIKSNRSYFGDTLFGTSIPDYEILKHHMGNGI